MKDLSVASGKGIAVAIDGPSGAGKSTVAKAIAKGMRAQFLDTGAMYRALTWKALAQQIDLADGDSLQELALRLPLRFAENPQDISADRVFVGETEVTEKIRTDEVNRAVSQVAAHPQVRQAMVKQQQNLMQLACEQGRGCVAEGRDITTVVAPWAQVRVLLTANEAVRQARRQAQSGVVSAASMAARDKADAAVNDLTHAAAGVVLVDSSNLTLEQTIDAVAELVLAAAEAVR